MKSPSELRSELVSPSLARRRRRRWLSLLGLGGAAVAALTFTSLRPEPTPPLIDVARVQESTPAQAIPEAAIPQAETVAEAETLAEAEATEPAAAGQTEAAVASPGQVMRLPPVYINVSVASRKSADTTSEPPATATETGHE